jgi:hypothetical protein
LLLAALVVVTVVPVMLRRECRLAGSCPAGDCDVPIFEAPAEVVSAVNVAVAGFAAPPGSLGQAAIPAIDQALVTAIPDTDAPD